jgi:hypothetical protein
MVMNSSKLARITELDCRHLSVDYVALRVAGYCVGQVHKPMIDTLLSVDGPHGRVFRALPAMHAIELIPETHQTVEHRTAGLHAAAEELVRQGYIKKLRGDEMYALDRGTVLCCQEDSEEDKLSHQPHKTRAQLPEPFCIVDRNAAPHFGATSPGVHLICYKVISVSSCGMSTNSSVKTKPNV